MHYSAPAKNINPWLKCGLILIILWLWLKVPAERYNVQMMHIPRDSLIKPVM